VEFQDVVRRRRMVRRYDLDRPVPAAVVDLLVANALRAPSAGFSQGWGFLILDQPPDVARFRQAATPPEEPEDWFAASFEAPLVSGPFVVQLAPVVQLIANSVV
jgi:nitroreductase